MNKSCPLCNSKLIVEGNTWKCTNNRLKYWNYQFNIYDESNNEKKQQIFNHIDNKRMFMEMYQKWSMVDDKGNKTEWNCDYTTHTYEIVPDNKIIMVDPIQVKRLERKLGRPITSEELEEDKITVNGIEHIFQKVSFPDDF